MTTIATVLVSYDPGTKTVTCVGGRGAQPDGSVDVEYGPGNTITFMGSGQDVKVWTFAEVKLTKQGTEDDPSTFSTAKTDTQIVLTDNNAVPGTSDIIYGYVVHVNDLSSNTLVRSLDPKIKNKPNTQAQKKMRSGYA
ncbi:MAG: DP-EP family protein [Planctomycetes bacterium]|nr:DP-EP family protein [Planctomycetota bacterium]